MIANLVTLARLPLLGGILWFLSTASPTLRFVAVPLILIFMLMDSLDGLIARARDETSLLGSVLDIAADRSAEYVMWVFFTYLRLISPVIPILVLIRGTFVDAVRSVGTSHGVKPFDMMRSDLGRWLVGSPFMRTSYAVVKITAFVLLGLTHALLLVEHPLVDFVFSAATIAAWLGLVFCLARGIPVLVEAPHALADFEA